MENLGKGEGKGRDGIDKGTAREGNKFKGKKRKQAQGRKGRNRNKK